MAPRDSRRVVSSPPGKENMGPQVATKCKVLTPSGQEKGVSVPAFSWGHFDELWLEDSHA